MSPELEKVRNVLQQTKADVKNFSKKGGELIEKLKKIKNFFPLIESFIIEFYAEFNSLIENIEKAEGAVERVEENMAEEAVAVETEKDLALSMRFEIASVLDDLVNHFPDVLLRENLEIISKILRDETKKEIKNHFIYPRLVKKFA